MKNVTEGKFCLLRLNSCSGAEKSISSFEKRRDPLSVFVDIAFRIRLYMLQCFLQVMTFHVHVGGRGARKVLDLLPYHHHVCLLYRHSDVVASEIFAKRCELVQLLAAPLLRSGQVVFDEAQALAECWHVDVDFSLESSQKSGVDVPARENQKFSSCVDF
jgi:hypothetical protein